jgi:hypothetical protein
MQAYITPNTLGHYPPGFPAGSGAVADPTQNLDLIDPDKPNIDLIKRTVQAWQNSADTHTARVITAFDTWHSRWPGQTIDGRKWSDMREGIDGTIWPWEGASDSRVRTVEKVVWDHYTVAMYALLNMKIQAKSTRPVESIRESQQMTTLLNWMIFTHMQTEINREWPLLVNWAHGFGSAVVENVWEQESRLDFVEVQRTDLYSWAQQQGDAETLDDFLSKFFDDAYTDDLIRLAQSISPILTKRQARAIIGDMKAQGSASVPIPYIFKSKPRWQTLQPMVDILFDPSLDDMQHARAIDRIEWVSETDLTDRITTAGYDPDFVDKALSYKGTDNMDWRNRYQLSNLGLTNLPYGGSRTEEITDKVKLHHFWQRGLVDSRVPALFRTVIHEGVDIEALHEPCDYKHGQYPYTAIRREFHQRPILTSRGIPEIGYTWENEIKEQRDGRSDMVALALRPPLMAPYNDILRLKQEFSPGAAIPERRAGDVRFFQVPGYQNGSIEIENSVKADIAEFFGLFGVQLDPILKTRRHQELADSFIGQFKPVIRQTGQLLRQYLPDNDVAQVVGQLARPFQVDRADIQAEYEYTATCDMRDIDPAFLKEKLGYLAQLKQMDTGGVLDANKALRIGAEAVDYTLADEAIQDTGPATDKEIQDEKRAISRIIGSGLAEDLPQAGNFQLRSQVLQGTIQEGLQTGGQDFARRLTPVVQQILKNRAQYYQNQIQQYTQNPQIGRSLITAPFSNQAPTLQNASANMDAS